MYIQSATRIEEEAGRSSSHVQDSHSTAAACSSSSPLMKEPSDFLDSAITAHSVIHNSHSAMPPPSTAQQPPSSFNPEAAAAEFKSGTTGKDSCCYWGHWPAGPECCWTQQQRHRQRRRPPDGALQLGGAPSSAGTNSTGHHQSYYSRIYSSVRSVASNMYASLRTRPKEGASRLKMYEERLRKARWAARSVGTFYNLSTFMALCSLTWATVVLLGAFVDNLRFVDYAMVTSLLILEAVRLASASFFTILLTHGLARSSQNPLNILHGTDHHYQRAFAARILSSLLQTILILPSFVCPIIRFRHIHEYQDQNIHLSLFIFYLLVISNALVSSITLFFSSASFFYLRDRHDQSILRYYDELTQRAISFGVIHADEFQFFEFAYRMLGSEFVRIVQPEAVVKNHRRLIEYLYRHRLGQDFLLIFLGDGDAFVQQAAVNMAGFWADPSKNVGLEEVKLSERVLSALADKVGFGQVGWAAVNSFGGLARRDPRILAETRASCGMPLLDRLAELVDGKRSSSLAYVRTIVLFYHYSYQKGQDVAPLGKLERELVGELKQLLQGGAKVQRARLYAAYLLHLMGHMDASCYDDVANITPSLDAYWFQVEVDLLLFVRRQCDMYEPPSDLMHVRAGFIRQDDTITPHGIRLL